MFDYFNIHIRVKQLTPICRSQPDSYLPFHLFSLPGRGGMYLDMKQALETLNIKLRNTWDHVETANQLSR